mmetsp:Transcript_24575/g.79044  ORF Transcript_24575/g.79044 Transcript_24575/m.79044 type:complete len:316 (+) Transcript_24575:448-1395(+)
MPRVRQMWSSSPSPSDAEVPPRCWPSCPSVCARSMGGGEVDSGSSSSVSATTRAPRRRMQLVPGAPATPSGVTSASSSVSSCEVSTMSEPCGSTPPLEAGLVAPPCEGGFCEAPASCIEFTTDGSSGFNAFGLTRGMLCSAASSEQCMLSTSGPATRFPSPFAYRAPLRHECSSGASGFTWGEPEMKVNAEPVPSASAGSCAPMLASVQNSTTASACESEHSRTLALPSPANATLSSGTPCGSRYMSRGSIEVGGAPSSPPSTSPSSTTARIAVGVTLAPRLRCSLLATRDFHDAPASDATPACRRRSSSSASSP